jgi:LPS-assembly protein
MMRRLLIALLLIWAHAARAQEPAVLVADSVRVEGDSRLVADGAVEVLYDGARLKAARIAYDRATGRLSIDGPIVLEDGGRVLILAEAAELDEDLRNGILTSARVVLDEQLQMAARSVRRVDGRYTELDRVVASSCQVCASNPVPLWSIRAARVIHDQEARQVWFEDAVFQVFDVPVLWLPRLRLPDPTLTRATGFLIPNIRTNSRLGTGIKIPYFIAMGPSRDLTLTPYVSAHTRTLEVRYRQAFRAGRLQFDGAVSGDDILEKTRAYLFGHGEFRLPFGFRLDFAVELTSDPAYLLDYGYSSKDRLQTFLRAERVRRNERIAVSAVNFRTLRDSEIPVEDQLPYLLGEAVWDRRYPGIAGGEGRLTFTAAGHERTSSADMLGRDVVRLGVDAGWQRREILGPGIEASIDARLRANTFFIGQDSTFDPSPTVIVPAIGGTLRWPWARTGAGGARLLVEPIVQVAWSDSWGPDVPNEDSALVEFDQGNLLSLSRFPGHDRNEVGLRSAVGLAFTRYDPAGWSIGATVGRVSHDQAAADFTDASGLGGGQSDWLVALQLRTAGGLSLTTRAQVGDGLSVTKAETRIAWIRERLLLSASHVWIVPESDEGRPERTNELLLDTDWAFRTNWSASAAMRYDFDATRAQSASVGLNWQNECVAVDLSLSRRFTSSTSVRPTTDVGLKVSLNGFGRDGREFRGTCAR